MFSSLLLQLRWRLGLYPAKKTSISAICRRTGTRLMTAREFKQHFGQLPLGPDE